ncbi:MAG TPA: hypothetical protein PKN95_11060 [Verrucomicrobiota bacterium]|nr:hypothetical protein [Verrucomicrobiota bacterium]HNT14334.1 hypothetical protein [Verrucomicrobiota bacterium]
MHDSHWWLVKLVLIQTAYLIMVIWGMRALQRKASRLRVSRDGVRRLDRLRWSPSATRIPKNS